MPLQAVQFTVQQIAEAVAAVLKVEVEIADAKLTRVAGTGKSQVGVLRTMAGEDHVYQSALRTGEPLIITNPGFHEICKPCIHAGNCNETGEICCPIQVDGKGIGVIGLLAFDTIQRQRLFENVDATINFLKKMAELIAAKVKENEIYLEQQRTLKTLTTVMNYLDQGVIAVNDKGEIFHLNKVARDLMQVREEADTISEAALKPFRKFLQLSPEQIEPTEVTVMINNEPREFVVSTTPLEVNGSVTGQVVSIHDLNRMVTLAKQFQARAEADPFALILGNSPVITAMKETARNIAASDSTVLIRGESGTGKELFAQAIHRSSPRSKHDFVSINCGAIPEHLLESELFGYEEGAFTGAKKGGKIGKLESADKGTLFLDEIGDMPVHLQVKILRVLQEKQVERIGSVDSPKPVDIRVIAATHRNLEERVQAGLFREDLYYRLNVIPLTIAPLRARREDIMTIADYYLKLYVNRLNKPIQGFTLSAQNALLAYEWPGNVRELANAIEYAVNMEHSSFITHERLPQRIQLFLPSGEYPGAEKGRQRLLNLKLLERQAIVEALRLAESKQESKERAAELLGISRATLFRKIKEYGIKLEIVSL